MPRLDVQYTAATATPFHARVSDDFHQVTHHKDGSITDLIMLPLGEATFARVTRLITPDAIEHLRFMAEFVDPELQSFRIDAKRVNTPIEVPEGITAEMIIDPLRELSERLVSGMVAKDRHEFVGESHSDDKLRYFFRAHDHFTPELPDYSTERYSSVICAVNLGSVV